MNIGILTHHEISVKKLLEIAFWRKMAKAIEKLRQLLAAQGVQLPCVQKVIQIKNFTKFTKGW